MAVVATEAWTGTNGAAWPGQWSGRGVGGSAAHTIQTNRGRQQASGASYTVAVAVLAGTYGALDLLVSFAPDSTAESYNSIVYRFGENAGAGIPFEGYTVNFYRVGGGFGVELYRTDTEGGVDAPLDSAAIGSPSTGRYWVRIRAVGSTHQVRVWADGGAEPGTWTLEGTDGTYASGGVALLTVNGDSTTARYVDWDGLVVDDTASGAASVNPVPAIVAVRSGVAAVTATTAVNGTPAIVAVRSGVAAVTATAQVAGTPAVVAVRSGVAQVTAVATSDVTPTPAVVAVRSGVAAVTATAAVAPSSAVVAVRSGIAAVTGTGAVVATPAVVAVRSAVASVIASVATPAAPDLTVIDDGTLEVDWTLPDADRVDMRWRRTDVELPELQTQTSAPWHLDRIDQRSNTTTGTYTYRYTGAGVTIYVLDSGTRRTHTEFGGRVLDLPRAFESSDVTGGDWGGPFVDEVPHGTPGASLAGGATYGAAKGVTLVAVKVGGAYFGDFQSAYDCDPAEAGDFLTEGITTADYLAGFDWILADHAAHPGPAIITDSSTARSYTDDGLPDAHGNPDQAAALEARVQAALDAGMLVFCWGGHWGEEPHWVPATMPGTVTVGGIDTSTRRFIVEPGYESNVGPFIDLFSPAQIAAAAGPDSDTDIEVPGVGTSSATPVAAGAAALLLEQNPHMTPARLRQVVLAQATVDAINLQSPAYPGTPNRLVYSLASTTEWTEVLDVDAPYELDGLEPGGSYEVQVRQTVGADTSGWSTAAAATLPVTVTPTGAAVAVRSGAAVVTSTAAITPSSAVVAVRSAVAQVVGTGQVVAVAAVVAVRAGVGDVGTATTVDAVAAVVAVRSAVAQLAATADVGPRAAVVDVRAAVASVTATTAVTPAGTAVVVRSAVADVIVGAAVMATPAVVAVRAGVGDVTGAATINPRPAVIAARAAIGAVAGTGSVVPTAAVIAVLAAVANVGNSLNPLVVRGPLWLRFLTPDLDLAFRTPTLDLIFAQEAP